VIKPRRDAAWLRTVISTETTGGIVTLFSAIAGLVVANSVFADSYSALIHWDLSFADIGLTFQSLVADGLLTLFFFVIGLELKHEFVFGSLANLSRAGMAIAAAIGGMVVPALIYVAFNNSSGDISGWGVPMATDIALALMVLSLLGSRVSMALRAFLLTTAVVDDLVVIVLLALVFSQHIVVSYVISFVLLCVMYVLVQRVFTLNLPLATLAFLVPSWWLLHQGGVHPTVAGAALGLLTVSNHVDSWRSTLQPWSSLVVVPLFAFVETGIPLDVSQIGTVFSSAVGLGIVVALIVGKPLGIFSAARIYAWISPSSRGEISWREILGLGIISGIGFTVALLLTHIALPIAVQDIASLAIVIASVMSGVVAFLYFRFTSSLTS
jgi:NhaA family Na+:H+ antiporter